MLLKRTNMEAAQQQGGGAGASKMKHRDSVTQDWPLGKFKRVTQPAFFSAVGYTKHPSQGWKPGDNVWKFPSASRNLTSMFKAEQSSKKLLKPRRAIFQAGTPDEGDGKKWCRYQIPHGGPLRRCLWQESKYFEGSSYPPWHPQVQSFNRFIAAATTPVSSSTKVRSRHSLFSIDRGRAVWANRQRVAKGYVRRPASCVWAAQPEITPYGVGRVVYAVVSRVRSEHRCYVGVTTQCPFVRETARVNVAFTPAPGRRSTPFEEHIASLGSRQRAYDEYYVIVLEHVPLPEIEEDQAWETHVRPYEKFWVAFLGTALNRGGWNVDHAPPSLIRDQDGVVVRAGKEQVRRARGRRNGPLATFRSRTVKRASWQEDSSLPLTPQPCGPSLAEGWQGAGTSMSDGRLGAAPLSPPMPSAPPSPPGEGGEADDSLPPASPVASQASETDDYPLSPHSKLSAMSLTRREAVELVEADPQLQQQMQQRMRDGESALQALASIFYHPAEPASPVASQASETDYPLSPHSKLSAMSLTRREAVELVEADPQLQQQMQQRMWHGESALQALASIFYHSAEAASPVASQASEAEVSGAAADIHGPQQAQAALPAPILALMPPPLQCQEMAASAALHGGTSDPPYRVTVERECWEGPTAGRYDTVGRFQAITKMDEYANKSFEELRLEDYIAAARAPAPVTVAAASSSAAVAPPPPMLPTDAAAVASSSAAAAAPASATVAAASSSAAAVAPRDWRTVAPPQDDIFTDTCPTLSEALKKACLDRPPLQTSEAERIVRATDAFGILAMPLKWNAPPSDMTVHKAFVEVRDRLNHQVRAQEPSANEHTKQVFRYAKFRVNDAWFKLRQRGPRLQAWTVRQANRQPITQTIECPIDTVRLRAFLLTPEARVWDADRRRTLGSLVQEVLDATRNGHAGTDEPQGVGTLTIEYRHSKMGARLVAAGFVRCSREYAKGADPFKLPSALRSLALGRLGLDFDDVASYPTAAAALLYVDREIATTFIRHREHILRHHGSYYFLPGFSPDWCRKHVKALYNAIDMDGGVHSWCDRQKAEPGWNPVAQTVAPDVDLSSDPKHTGQGLFSLSAYQDAQRRRTVELQERLPMFMTFVEQQHEAWDMDKQHHLTGKSYFFQDAEGISRRAKQQWCREHGCVVINLQHDGLFARLLHGMDPVEVRAALVRVSSNALGFAQAVEIKPWPQIAISEFAFVRAPATTVQPRLWHRGERPPASERLKRTRRGRRAPRATRSVRMAEPSVAFEYGNESSRSLAAQAWSAWQSGGQELQQWWAQLTKEHGQEVYGVLCGMATRRPRWRTLRDLIAQGLHAAEVSTYQRRKRSLVINGYASDLMNGLCISKLILSEEIKGLVPEATWKEVGHPMAVLKYATAPARIIMNFPRAVRDLDSHWWRGWEPDWSLCTVSDLSVLARQMRSQQNELPSLPMDVWSLVANYMRSPPPLVRRSNYRGTPTPALAAADRCRCHEACFAPFRDSSGHVATTDLAIVGLIDAELKALMEMGPSHRSSHVRLWPPPEKSGYEDTFQGRLKYMFDTAFQTYIKDKQRRYECAPFVFHPWTKGVLEQLLAKVDALSPSQVACGRAQQARAQGEMNDLAKRVAGLQRHLVFAQADKERVYTVCCRHRYEQKVMAELESGTSYAFEGAGAASVHAWRVASQKHENAPEDNQHPGPLPQMPTGDAEAPPQGLPAPLIGPAAPVPPPAPTEPQDAPEFGNCVTVMQHLHQYCKTHHYERKETDEDGKFKKQRDGESELEAFIRRYKLSYLYATLKTHKEPWGWRFIAGGTSTALEEPNKWLNCAMQGLVTDLDRLHAESTREMEQHASIKGFYKKPVIVGFNLKDTRGMVDRLMTLRAEIERHRTLADPDRRRRADSSGQLDHMFAAVDRLRKHAVQFGVWDFTTLYLSLEHELIIGHVRAALARIFQWHASQGFPWLDVHLVEKTVEWQKEKPQKSPAGHRFYDATELSELTAFIVRHAFVAVGDTVYRQKKGIPMGFSASPMIAVFTLSWAEIIALEQLATLSMQADGAIVAGPTGAITLGPQTRGPFCRLVATLARCCRNIDDVLFINMSKREQEWAYATLYRPEQTNLQMKMECCSPARVTYLDTEVVNDSRGGLRTIHYDKRTEMQRKRGSSERARRFPHIDSVLSTRCKYAVLTGFLHRIHRSVTRRSNFVATVVAEIVHMQDRGYDPARLAHTLSVFMRRRYKPPSRAAAVQAEITARLKRHAKRKRDWEAMQRQAAQWACQLRAKQHQQQAETTMRKLRARLVAASALRRVERRIMARCDLSVQLRRQATEVVRRVEQRIRVRLQQEEQARMRREQAVINRERASAVLDQLVDHRDQMAALHLPAAASSAPPRKRVSFDGAAVTNGKERREEHRDIRAAMRVRARSRFFQQM